MSYKGTCYSLLEVGRNFISFVTDINRQHHWEMVNDDLDSFYGTTFKVKGIDTGGYFYVSFRHQKVIKNETYNKWYKTGYLTEDFVHTSDRDELTSVSGSPDIFDNSGYFLAFSVHKQFDKDLWMCEQGGNYNPTHNDLNLLPLKHRKRDEHGSIISDGLFNPPPFPDIGKPLLVQGEDEINTPIQYWFTLSRLNATITLKIGEYWQSITFGFLDGVDYRTYKFPAYIAGGTTGLTNTGWVYTPLYANTNSQTNGNRVLLRSGSIALSNGTLINATKFNRANSNFVIMSPQGIWECYYNFTQNIAVMPYYSYNQPTSNWGFTLGKPTRMTTGNVIYPAYVGSYDLVDFTEVFEKNLKVSPTLFPIMPVREIDANNRGVGGFVSDIFTFFSKIDIEGEYTINETKYLIVPNGWSERVMYYPSSIGVYSQWENDTLKDAFNESVKAKFLKIAIKLEE